MTTVKHKEFEAEVKESDEKNLTVEHFISTEAKDRGGDIMRADGMIIKGKVVVLMAHGRGPMATEPIAKPLSIKQGQFKNRKGILAKTQFFSDEIGQRLFKKTVEGFMPNWSIGYIPLEWKDIDRGDGREVSKWELLEYSPVGVPMNPDAQTIKGAGEIRFKIMPEESPDVILMADPPELEELMQMPDDAEEKPYPNEHACRINDPGKYDRIRRQNDRFGQGIHAIWGVKGNITELQALRFDKTKFSADQAKKWCSDNDYTCKPFEPASGKEEAEFEEKGIIPYKKHPLDPEGVAWDGPAEVAKAEVADLKVTCVWFDSENADNKGAYKGLHHRTGNKHTVWNGVRGLAAVVMGARGGMRVPQADMAGIKRHVAGHYKDFDKGNPPWESEGGKLLERTLLYLEGDQAAINFLGSRLLPELAEFFQDKNKQDDPMTSLLERMTELEKAVAALSASPDAGAKEGDGIDDSPPDRKPRLVVVDPAKQEDEIRRRAEEGKKIFLNVFNEVMGTMIKDQIEKAKGRVP